MLQLSTPDDVALRLAGRIQSERLRLRWKQSTLAERAGVSVPTVKRYEATGQVSMRTFLRMCHALGRLDELVGWLETPAASSLEELERREAARASGSQRRRGTR